MKKISKGFTLIELLVVIAVIAVLAAVIIASLGNTKLKGGDTAAKQDLNTIRTQANIYYSGPGTYSYGTPSPSCASGMFSADPVIATAINHATPNVASIACNSTEQTFAVAVSLKSSGVGYYCIDSNNIGKIISPSIATSGLVGAGNTYALNTSTGLCSI